MRINKRLNLAIPVEREDKSVLWVHSTPVSAEVFDTYFLPLAKTFSEIYTQGLGAISGPRVADKLLRKVAREMGVWDAPGGVQQGLLPEVHRLTNALVPAERGMQMMPMDDAVNRGFIDKQDASEIEAALVFFTAASHMHRRSEIEAVLNAAMSLWGAETTWLDCTEFMSSLQMSTQDANSGAKAT